MQFYHRLMRPNDADRMTNSVDPDQTAPETAPLAVYSGSTLFAETCLFKNLGPLRYLILNKSSVVFSVSVVLWVFSLTFQICL